MRPKRFNRLWQLAGVAVLGAVLGLVIGHDWGDEEPPPAPIAQAPEASPAPPEPSPPPPLPAFPTEMPQTAILRSSNDVEVRSVTKSAQFRRDGAPQAAPKVVIVPEKPRQTPAHVLVPKDWLLRGTAPQGYDVQSEREEVFSGNASVLMKSYEGAEISAGLNASLMQSVAADAWVGKRVKLTAAIRPYDHAQSLPPPVFAIWFRVTDAGHAVIEFKQADDIGLQREWQRVSVIADVPWSASEIAYGVNLQGKGGIWVDDVRVEALDSSIPATGRTWPNMLGVVAQPVSERGPLSQPANLDFEAVTETTDNFRQPPPDQIDRRRF